MSIGYALDILQPKYKPETVLDLPVNLEANRQFSGPTILGQITSANQNAIQTIVRASTPSAGTFTLWFGGYPIRGLAFNVTGAQVQAALEALPNIGKGNVTVAFAIQTWTITFAGDLLNKPQPTVVVTDNTTGVAFTASTTQAGIQNGAWGPYDDSASDGRQVARAILRHACSVEPNGRVSLARTQGGNEHGVTMASASVAFTGGVWETSKIAGVDANAIADLGRLISGTTANGLLSLR